VADARIELSLVLATVPTLISDPGPAADSYEAIERRVWWGALAGLGALLATLPSVRPWSVAFVSFVAGLYLRRRQSHAHAESRQ
jgi:hypothetical protein